MSKIFELFGYRLDAWSAEAEENCAKAWCPFMNADEVNILAFGYGDIDNVAASSGILSLQNSNFYAGPINKGSIGGSESGGFVDIVKIGAPPPKDQLWRSLFLKPACANFFV